MEECSPPGSAALNASTAAGASNYCRPSRHRSCQGLPASSATDGSTRGAEASTAPVGTPPPWRSRSRELDRSQHHPGRPRQGPLPGHGHRPVRPRPPRPGILALLLGASRRLESRNGSRRPRRRAPVPHPVRWGAAKSPARPAGRSGGERDRTQVVPGRPRRARRKVRRRSPELRPPHLGSHPPPLERPVRAHPRTRHLRQRRGPGTAPLLPLEADRPPRRQPDEPSRCPTQPRAGAPLPSGEADHARRAAERAGQEDPRRAGQVPVPGRRDLTVRPRRR